MYAFTYEAPGNTADAAALAAQGGQYLAGGQSLLPSMRLRLARPEQIVDLNRVQGLAGIAVNGQTGKVGGKYPLSPWRVGIACVAGLILLALLAYYIGME